MAENSFEMNNYLLFPVCAYPAEFFNLFSFFLAA